MRNNNNVFRSGHTEELHVVTGPIKCVWFKFYFVWQILSIERHSDPSVVIFDLDLKNAQCLTTNPNLMLHQWVLKLKEVERESRKQGSKNSWFTFKL